MSVKTFAELIKEIEPGVIPEPIHFIDHNDELKKNSGTVPEPIHFKQDKDQLDERTGSKFDKWLDTDENKHLHPIPKSKQFGFQRGYANKPGYDRISHNLAHHVTLSKPHVAAIQHYTSDSKPLNNALLKKKKLSASMGELDKHLSHAIKSNPLKHKVTVTSGLGFDPRKHHKKGILHSPCYISASHDKQTAHGFAKTHWNKTNSDHFREGEQHLMHIHLKKGDHALHVDHVSEQSGEYETIIHKGAKLKHIKTDTYDHSHWGDHIKVHVHHYEKV